MIVIAENTRAGTHHKNADKHGRLHKREAAIAARSVQLFNEVGDEGERRQRGELMAKPLPVAAVVLPRESSVSARSRTSSGRPAHLRDQAARVVRHLGEASAESVMPRVESILTAAREMP